MDGTDMLHTRKVLHAMHGMDMLQKQHNNSCPSALCCMFMHANPTQLLLTKDLLTHARKARLACIPKHILSTKPMANDDGAAALPW